MSGQLCCILLMASTVHLFVIVSGMRVLDPEDDGQGKDIDATKTSLTFLPLRFNAKEPLQFVDGGSKLMEETKSLDTNRARAAMITPGDVKYNDHEHQMFGNNYVDDNDDDGDNFDSSHYGDTASDALSSHPAYSTTDTDLTDNVQNPEILDDNVDIFEGSTEDHNTNFSSFETKHIDSKSHGDAFYCPPCNCSHTASRFVIANCTDKKLDSFPNKLPQNTVVLNLSFNRFRKLNMSTLLTYPLLVNVSLDSNRILRNISRGDETNNTSNIKYLSLFDCGIIYIENGSFSIMPHLFNLTLRNNNLTHLTGTLFEGLHKLESLDLSENRITKIEVGTFDNFQKLKILDLSGNQQLGYSNKSLPAQLFKNLTNVRKLSLHRVSLRRDKSYPNQALEQLVNLQELWIDGLDSSAEFGPGMRSLKSLTHLHIGGGHHPCKIKNITETFFDNIYYLRAFVLQSCPQFVCVHPKAYSTLTNLLSLTIKYMEHYDIDTAFKDLTAFNNSKLTSVTFNHLRQPIHQCKYLGIEQARYVKTIDLKHLDLSDNRIVLLGKEFLDNLPKTLKRLILRRNKLTMETQSMNLFAVLTELREMDLSLQNANAFFNSDGDSVVEVQVSECSTMSLADRNKDDIYSRALDSQQNKPSICSELDVNIQSKNVSTDKVITNIPEITSKLEGDRRLLPPKLKILIATTYNMFGMQILTHKLNKNNSLSVIDFSKSFMSNWGSGRLPRGVTHANLADNYCTSIKKTFFQANNSHDHILLNNNFLGPDFATDDNGTIFANLKNTAHLDISTNLIYKLPRHFFQGLSNLNYLKISDNRLAYLNTSFRHMKNLQFIDLSKNSIRWINKETRNDLDAIATLSGHKIVLDLTMNPLPCTCAGLDVITWMATTKVHFRNKNLLKCDTDSMVSELVVDLEDRRETLQRLCMSKTALIIGCVAALTVVMITVGLGLMYRYRWKLRYLHNIANAAIFGFKPDLLPKSGCTFDASIIYTEETQDFVIDTCLKELELKRGHRLCVEDRDFLPGTYTVSNIVSAVRNSTKTVPVMTPTFYNGLFAEYSFKMAVMEELYKNRSVLHLLIYQPIANEQMSHDELKVMKRNSYIKYPPDEGTHDNIRQNFWDDLSLAIGHTKNPTTQQLPDLHEES